MYFFTADEHYNHFNIIRYQHRPFANVEQMNHALIANHNCVVNNGDTVIHAGDFAFGSYSDVRKNIIAKLNGKHIFLRGCHDLWLKDALLANPYGSDNEEVHDIWQHHFKREKMHVVVCHYAMRTWPRSHYGSIQLHGHSHGKLPRAINQYDIGVDNNNFSPVNFRQVLKLIMTEEV